MAPTDLPLHNICICKLFFLGQVYTRKLIAKESIYNQGRKCLSLKIYKKLVHNSSILLIISMPISTDHHIEVVTK